MPKKQGGYQLDLSQLRFYRRNGYLVIKGLFSNDQCDNFLSLLELAAEPGYPAIMNPDRNKVPEARKIMSDPNVVIVLDTLQDYQVVALMSQVLFKKANSNYANQAWNPHQDNTYPRSPYGAYITTNLFLSDANPKNGGLYIFPGSHVEPLLPAAPTVSYREMIGSNPGNPVEVPRGYEQTDLYIDKGELLILHGNVIHGSYANHSTTRSRPLFSASYISRWASRADIDFFRGKNSDKMPIEVR